MHVTVVGAGVGGLSCALELAERGVSVEVLERGESLGAGSCSWYAGGMLAPWCELAGSEPLIATLGVESIEWWCRRFPPTMRNGSLIVAHGRDTSELATFARRTRQHQWLDGDGIRALEPDLAGRFGKALFFGSEGHLDPRLPLYIVPRGEGLFMVGATMIESDAPTRISARSMLELLSAVYALHPAFGEAEIVEIGTGVRPAFPDNLPQIRTRGRVVYVNGFYRHGILVAPALARMTADWVLHNRFSPEVMREDPRERRLA